MDFFERYNNKLIDFITISQYAGNRVEYIQGGGGNTSVKLDDKIMAIKASGYCLKDITTELGYSILDYKMLSDFYYAHNPEDYEDIELAGSEHAKKAIREIEKLPALRPSVEAGFHSLLKTYVIHSHSIFANLVCCSANSVEIAKKAFEGTGIIWAYISYIDPGAKLTFAVRDAIQKVKTNTGHEPSVLLLQNHGIIVHSDDAKDCMFKHEQVNGCLANFFGITINDFPKVNIKKKGEQYTSDTPYLNQQLASGRYSYEILLKQPIYPDQMVFLIGTLGDKAAIDFTDGNVTYDLPESTARVIEETLTAVVFIRETIRNMGYEINTMGDAAKKFIANWESEKYRKSLAI